MLRNSPRKFSLIPMPGSQQSLGIISTVLKQQLRAAHTIHAAHITHATIIIWWSVPTLPGVCVSNSTNGCWDKLHLFFTCFEVVVVNFSQGKRDYCKHCFMIEWCKKLAKVNNDVNNCLKLLCHQKYIAGVVEKVRVTHNVIIISPCPSSEKSVPLSPSWS